MFVCEATRCILQPLFLYVMKLRAFPITEQTRFDYVQKQWKQALNVLNKNNASRVGAKGTETRQLTSDIPIYNRVHLYNPTSL